MSVTEAAMTNQPCSGTDTPAAVSRSFCGDFLFNTFCAEHPENPGNILRRLLLIFPFMPRRYFIFLLLTIMSPSFFRVIRF